MKILVTGGAGFIGSHSDLFRYSVTTVFRNTVTENFMLTYMGSF